MRIAVHYNERRVLFNLYSREVSAMHGFWQTTSLIIQTAKTILIAVVFLFSIPERQASAAWFEAKGQAVVFDGNKQDALNEATKDAIKHAMLFAGASIHSVQTLTNGLLSSEQLEITASGEVNQLELVSETWSGDVVTVMIRANILPQQQTCSSADFSKSIVSTHFPINKRNQATDGRIHNLGNAIPERLKTIMMADPNQAIIDHVANYTANWTDSNIDQQAPEFARQEHTQFVLSGQIKDISVERQRPGSLAFWKSATATRYFEMDIKLLDGITGAILLNQNYHFAAPWKFDRFTSVDVFSQSFWNSEYGIQLEDTLKQIATDLDMTLICQPSTGRVLNVVNNQLTVSIGQANGLKVGDKLSLYQVSEYTDTYGKSHLKYNIHPEAVIVVSSYVDNAILEPADGSLLSNIQPNDFVAVR